MQIKTYQPENRFTNFEAWQRYIVKELFFVQNKNLFNQAKDIFQPRLNITE